jgi:hypothetical protein
MYECKICGYKREDTPTERWDICPNCDSSDWMVEGDWNDKRWTTKTPTQEGWYWVYVYNRIELVKFIEHLGIDWNVYADDGVLAIPFVVTDISHWLGPLPMPEPPTKESESA